MSRELYLRLFVYILVFILCQKTGHFFFGGGNIFSRFHRKDTSGHIQNLRHSSLDSNVFNMYVQFQVFNLHDKRDIHVQKIKV